ncbi:hypothetical protein Taro_017289 [Colocasia esculenta]|uniref:Pentatricopeptide repeat-containing protein n=1 Tax=Colocasia esculenta TaxID=4460 RepID=A0A843UMS9_COLES|nr:hypothetical protein [Colocasia esculenta]
MAARAPFPAAASSPRTRGCASTPRPPPVATQMNTAEDAVLRSYVQTLTHSSRPPSKRAIITVLKASALFSTGALHTHVVKTGLGADRFVASALVRAYSEAGRLASAREVFGGVCEKDATLYTAMLIAHVDNGDIMGARAMFDEMPARDVVAWNALLSRYVHCGLPEDALQLLQQMQLCGFRPNEVTLVCALSACAQLSCLALGEWVHAYLNRAPDIRLTTTLINSLVNMYAKSGRLDAAYGLFLEEKPRTLASWNTMLSCFAAHGCSTSALALFSQMIKTAVVPDRISFLGVLTACAHAGAVGSALGCFDSMQRVYGFEPRPEHYGCLVDALSRRGHLQEAYELVKSMPSEPNACVWGALLAGCSHHHNFEIGLEAANVLVEMEPWEEGRYISLANMYAMRGRREDFIKVRQEMSNSIVQRTSGSSLIEVDGVVHEFVAGDRSHSRSNDIYLMIEHICSNLGG